MNRWPFKVLTLLLVGWMTAALLTSTWMFCHGIWFELFPLARAMNPQQAFAEMMMPPWWVTVLVVVVVEVVLVFRLFKPREHFRTRRGQCPACAYPVGTNPLCTECGKPVRVRSVAPAS